MPLIPILPSDSARAVEYKIQLAGQVAEVEDEIARLKLWREYYDGDHDVPLSDDQIAWLSAILGEDAPPIDNKCRVVVNKLRARLDVEGFLMPGEKASAVEGRQPDVEEPKTAAEWAWYWWRKNRMDSGERDLYLAALRDAWSYVIVGHNGAHPTLTLEERWDGTTGMRFFWDNARMHRGALYAVRYWLTRDPTTPEASNIQRITLYTSDAIYKFARPATREQRQALTIVGGVDDDPGLVRVVDERDGGRWPLPWVDSRGEPLGLAVVPFVAPRGSLVAPIIGLQRRLNKTWYDIDAAADQLAFGLIVEEYPATVPDRNEEDEDDGLGLRPGRSLAVGGGGRVHKLPADDLKPLLSVVRETVVAIAGNSEQPIFNFIPLGGEVPSGAALDELNRPLAEQAEECIPTFSDSWREVMRLAQKQDRLYGDGYRAEPVDLVVRWKPQPVSAEAREAAERSKYAGLKALAEALKVLVTDARFSQAGALAFAGVAKEEAAALLERTTEEAGALQEREARAARLLDEVEGG